MAVDSGFVGAAMAFGGTSRILKIRAHWLQQIIEGKKDLEIRGGKCPHVGWISLASTGTRLIMCRAKLGMSYPLTQADKERYAKEISDLGYKTPWGWPIEEVKLLTRPFQIPSEVAMHSVVWVSRNRWEKFDSELSCRKRKTLDDHLELQVQADEAVGEQIDEAVGEPDLILDGEV